MEAAYTAKIPQMEKRDNRRYKSRGLPAGCTAAQPDDGEKRLCLYVWKMRKRKTSVEFPELPVCKTRPPHKSGRVGDGGAWAAKVSRSAKQE